MDENLWIFGKLWGHRIELEKYILLLRLSTVYHTHALDLLLKVCEIL